MQKAYFTDYKHEQLSINNVLNWNRAQLEYLKMCNE